jgi:hypothetical protein
MTAVEWFAEELYQKVEMKGDGKVFDELLDQAKEMEEEQRENAFENGMNAVNIHNLEQYYNETFKQQDQ